MKFPFYKRIWFKLALTIIVGLSLAFYISYYFSTQYSHDIVVQNTKKEFNTAIKIINNFIRVVGETSQVWAKHTVIDNQLDELILHASPEMLHKQLVIDKEAVSADTILLLDKEATIIGNVGSVQMMGNTLKYNALVKETFETKTAMTMIMRERESFIIYSSSPMIKDNNVIGMLLIGYYINDAFLENVKKNIDLDVALVGNSAIMSSTNWAGEGSLDVLPIEFIRYQTLLEDENNLMVITYNDNEFLVSARKLDYLDSSISGSILVGIPSKNYESIKLDILQKAALFFGLLFLISLIVVFMIARRSTQAILLLSEATNSVSEGNLDVKIDLKSRDEFEQLGNNFNGMIQNIKNKDALIQEHTLNLETLVNRRTQQLQEVNMKLEGQNLALEISNKSFEQLINATIESIVLLENGKIIDINTSGLKLFHFSKKEEALGLMIDDFVSDKSMSKIKENTSLDMTSEYEVVMLNRHAEEFFALLKEQNVQRNNQTIRIMTLVDLTELKTKDKLIANQAKMSAMGEMIENIAHQWRQPLSVISTNASSITAYKQFDKLTDEVLEQSMNNIVTTSKYLSSTIDDFRNFFRTDKEKVTFNIAEIIQTNLDLVYASLKQENINLHANIDKEVTFYGYKNEFIQAIINIMNNAKDAMQTINNSDDRHLFVDVKKENNKLIILIKDSGGGIPEKIIEKIFEPYFTTKHQSHGTGLGLYMTHQIIVLNMDGKLNVKNVQYKFRNKTYKGAEFIITLFDG